MSKALFPLIFCLLREHLTILLYAKVIRRRNPELHKNYTELTSNGVLKRTSLEADYERSAKRKFTNQDLKYFEELIQREE